MDYFYHVCDSLSRRPSLVGSIIKTEKALPSILNKINDEEWLIAVCSEKNSSCQTLVGMCDNMNHGRVAVLFTYKDPETEIISYCLDRNIPIMVASDLGESILGQLREGRIIRADPSLGYIESTPSATDVFQEFSGWEVRFIHPVTAQEMQMSLSDMYHLFAEKMKEDFSLVTT